MTSPKEDPSLALMLVVFACTFAVALYFMIPLAFWIYVGVSLLKASGA